MKKKVHIISHSHWDREWYIPYEKHHMLLVELIDNLLDLFEEDPDFNSFHLDGQTILLDDYLQVRPENRDKIQEAISKGKLHIGPFYILQDGFLISPESNVRNMLIGAEESKKWGDPVKLGYFPDTFGNMGQGPQLMRKARLETAAFGRGVKPIGFDNQVLETESYNSPYSEMYWKSPDQSEILGLLFANWYSNGNEIPSEKEAAIKFWDQKLAEAEQFASTKHLLFMNGCDHQPVQRDITKAIALANELYPEYEFIHSNFTDYIDAVQKDLPENLGIIEGELTSQETDGWYTLANTASSRVYLKQWNTKVQRQLENIAEPLASMAYEITGHYPHDQLDYAWKTLLQNHPHDSICGCGVDEVYHGMIPRFEGANEVGKYIAEEAVDTLKSEINTDNFAENSFPFIVFNTNGLPKSGEAVIDIELERKIFSEGLPKELYRNLRKKEPTNYYVVDEKGKTIPAHISPEDVHFDFDLPKDGFRVPYMKRFVTVRLPLKEIPAFSWKSFALVTGQNTNETIKIANEDGRTLENDLIKVEIADNGLLTIADKENNSIFEDLLNFEDTGDIANEYIHKQPEDDQAIFSRDTKSNIELIENNEESAIVKLTNFIEIPVSADSLLTEEQKQVVDFTVRKAKRSKETSLLTIETKITLMKDSKKIDFETRLNNQMKDHRLRVLFPTDLKVETHEADSIFEVVKRPNKVSKNWKNPTNPQHQHAFVNLHDYTQGITVGNFGLNEYEIVNNNTIALTLLRCVGEMGDWGHFPTPEAQCIGEHTFNYSVEFHETPNTRYETYKHAYTAQVPFSTTQVSRHSRQLPSSSQYLQLTSKTFAPTALKRRKHDNALIMRGYNMSDKGEEIVLEKSGKTPSLLNLLEESTQEIYTSEIGGYEIRTIGFI